MKNIFTLILLIYIPLIGIGQASKSCCSTSSHDFAMLGKSTEFQTAHLSPEPIKFDPSIGVEIKFPTSDGKEGTGFAIMADKKSDNYLIIPDGHNKISI